MGIGCVGYLSFKQGGQKDSSLPWEDWTSTWRRWRGKRISNRENSKCKSSEVGTCLEWGAAEGWLAGHTEWEVGSKRRSQGSDGGGGAWFFFRALPKATGKFERMIYVIFKWSDLYFNGITVVTVLRIDCRGREWIPRNWLEDIAIFLAREDNDLDQ